MHDNALIFSSHAILQYSLKNCEINAKIMHYFCITFNTQKWFEKKKLSIIFMANIWIITKNLIENLSKEASPKI